MGPADCTDEDYDDDEDDDDEVNGYFVCILLVGCLVLIAVYSAKEPAPEMQATTVRSCLSG